PLILLFFVFYATPPPEIYTLSLHDALPILHHDRRIREVVERRHADARPAGRAAALRRDAAQVRTGSAHRSRAARRKRRPGPADRDRKSTRLNSSHSQISYAVFCLKKKKKKT